MADAENIQINRAKTRLKMAGTTGGSDFGSEFAQFAADMATATLNPGEESQLAQTIEMFEVIVQSQPNDTQSLEILKEAYTKLGREPDIVHTSKRIAQAYLQQGQLSSAIFEYETILQRRPNDLDVRAALKQIESRTSDAVAKPAATPVAMTQGTGQSGHTTMFRRQPVVAAPVDTIDDGRKTMHRLFVEGRLMSEPDFDECWEVADYTKPPVEAVPPFIHRLAEKQILPAEKSLRLISEKSRVSYLPLERYDIDLKLARAFPAEVCRRWCVLPFDRMSKSVLVATANPFNQQAAKELAEATSHRLLWYLASPAQLTSNLRKTFR